MTLIHVVLDRAWSLWSPGFSRLLVRAVPCVTFSRHDLEEICGAAGSPDRLSGVLQEDDGVGMGAEMVTVLFAAFSGRFAAWVENVWKLAVDAGWEALLGTVGACACVDRRHCVDQLWVDGFFLRWFFRVLGRWRSFGFACDADGLRGLLDCCCTLAGSGAADDGRTFEEEIRTIVTEGHREGLLEEDAREMIEGVIDLATGRLEIMTPRTDMAAVDQRWIGSLDRVGDRCGPHAVPGLRQEPRRHRRHSLHQGPAAGAGHRRRRLAQPIARLLREPSSCPKPSRSTSCCRSSSRAGPIWPWCSTSTAACPAW